MTKEVPKRRTTLKSRQRLRAVEELYLLAYGPREIHDLIGKTYGVTYGTVRNDIVDIRKSWETDADSVDAYEGRIRYLAAMRDLRRRVMQESEEEGGRRDYVFAHKLDKEIARFSGVKLKSDERTLHLDITAAREFIDKLTAVAFEFITSPQEQEAYVARLDEVAAESVG